MLSPENGRIEATLTLAQVADIVRMEEVLFIDEPGPVELDMNIARQISGAVYLESLPENFRGQGVRAEVMDEGLFVDHSAYPNDPIMHTGNSTAQVHGTKVYGCIFGDGTASPVAGAKGILPAAIGVFATFSAFQGEPEDECLPTQMPTPRYTHIAELVDPTKPYQCVFQTNSWGHGTILAGGYSTISNEMDRILFDKDILVCQSHGNTGSQYARPESWAKNILSVGGVKHFNTLCREDDRWSCGACPPDEQLCSPNAGNVCQTSCASIGPAADWRIKPDLTHFYDNILTTCPGTTCYTTAAPPPDPTAHLAGTSGATPLTCGHSGLIFQMWHEGVFCGFGGAASVFASRPHMTTVKALMINTAYRYPLATEQPGSDFTRHNQGWGMVDVKTA